MAPKTALTLFEDDCYFEMVDLRDHVGKRGKQLQRIRSRATGSQGKIRQRIEGLTSTSITIYKSTVVVIELRGGPFPRPSSRHDCRRRRARNLLSFLSEPRGRTDSSVGASRPSNCVKKEIRQTGFENLVPGLMWPVRTPPTLPRRPS